MKETLEEAAEKLARAFDNDNYKALMDLVIEGAKWQQEQLCNSEIIQRIRATNSDAEARRIIKSI